MKLRVVRKETGSGGMEIRKFPLVGRPVIQSENRSRLPLCVCVCSRTRARARTTTRK
jgi:hypothetical protein